MHDDTQNAFTPAVVRRSAPTTLRAAPTTGRGEPQSWLVWREFVGDVPGLWFVTLPSGEEIALADDREDARDRLRLIAATLGYSVELSEVQP